MTRSRSPAFDPHAPRRHQCAFRFYAELNDFLPHPQRQQSFHYDFIGTPAVRDAIQAIGVPHTEVDLILIDGRSVDFGQRLNGGEQVSVYPVFERFDIADAQHLRPQPLREPRFAVDVHLGTLARRLRLCGFDTLYRNDWTDPELLACALAEHRILLSRDRGLLFHKALTHAYYLRSTEPDAQLRELVQALQLASLVRPFSRCLRCNEALQAVDADSARSLSNPPPPVYDHYSWCPRCRQLYWPGCHYQAMQRQLQRCLDDRCAMQFT